MPHLSRFRKNPIALTESRALMQKEIEKEHVCGCCSIGFDDIEEYRQHIHDEEHQYQVLRRGKIMVPGLGYCPACSQLIQSTSYWNTHKQAEKHNKCIASLQAIGITGDYSLPLGCTVRGQLGGPIDPTGISCTVANGNGYGKASNAAGVPIIGLNFVKMLTQGPNQQFKCDVCDEFFKFSERLVHLSGVKHRQTYLTKYYSEWNEEVLKIPNNMIQRVKNRLSFYAHKVEKLELENETSDAKALRDLFFNLEKYLKTKKSENNRKRSLDHLKKIQGRQDPRRESQPIHTAHNSRRSPPRFEPPFPRSDGRPLGYDDPRSRDRTHRETYPPPKRRRSGEYSQQYEIDQAVEAINVLERFTLIQMEQEVRDKMQRMRDAVKRGSRLSDLQGYGDMMSAIKAPPHSVGRASRSPPRSPPRPSGHITRTPHKVPLQEDLLDPPQPHRGAEYGGPPFGGPPPSHFGGPPPSHFGGPPPSHFGGPPPPEFMMHQGHRRDRTREERPYKR